MNFNIRDLYFWFKKKGSDDIKVEFYELIKEWWGLEVFGFLLKLLMDNWK